MPIYKFTTAGIQALEETSFGSAGLHERRDLQRLLREHVEVIAPDTLVISEEFGDWEDAKRRIDLLAIDKEANLVVIELKRTEDGGHMELQSIRYASMVSKMTFDKATDVFAQYLQKLGKDWQDAGETILEFLEWDEPDEDVFAKDVRIILASADFSPELTTSVLWLNEHDIDIRCVRLKPYRLDEHLLVDVQKIIPLPEAESFQIRLREKAQKEREARASNVDFTRFDVRIGDELTRSVWKRNALYLVSKRIVESGTKVDEIAGLFTWRKNAWFSVDGTVNASEFQRVAVEKATSGGHSFDTSRWFCEEGELFHASGRTYALTNQWGGDNWRKAMNVLKERYPQLKIEFSPTS